MEKFKKFVVNFTDHKDVLKLKTLIPKISALPILHCLRLTVKDQVLKIVCTDLENTAIYSMPVLSEGDFDFIVDSQYLFNLIKNHKKANIKITPIDDQIFFYSEEMHYAYKITSKLSQFPLLPDISIPESAPEVDYPNFYKILSHAINFASRDLQRPLFAGVFFHYNNRKYYVVATDGKKIYEEKLDFKLHKSMRDIVIGSTLIKTFLKFKKLGDVVTTHMQNNHVVLKSGCLTLMGYLVEGKFPDYTKAMTFTDEAYTNFKFHKSLLLSIHQAIKPFVSYDTSRVKHYYTQNSLNISATQRETDTVICKLEIDNDIDGHSEYGVNINYFILCLNAFDESEEIDLRIPRSSNLPLLMSSGNKCILLMPLRLS